MRKARRGPKCGSRRGSEIVEGMIMMLPFLALVFIIIDASYGLFINATLQYAVQAGVTVASTDSNTAAGVMSDVQNAVNTKSLNLIPASSVVVTFYTPDMNPAGGNPVPNQTGNVVQASVTYPFSPLAPLFRSGAAITLTATAASVLTAPPGT
jgi:Flp pilus assembly protein TadG